MKLLCSLALLAALAGCATSPEPAPRPLYRDPTLDGAADVSLGASELLPALAVLPFMLYQLAGFGTLHFLVSRTANWAITLGILGLIVAATVANRMASYTLEKAFVSLLVIGMVALVFYGVTKLRQMQVAYDTYCPPKEPK